MATVEYGRMRIGKRHSEKHHNAGNIHHQQRVERHMESVTGIGGFFFKARNPDAVAQWYLDNLGINLVPQDYNMPAWEQEAGETVSRRSNRRRITSGGWNSSG